EEPLFLDEGRTATVQTVVKPTESGSWDVEVYSLGAGDDDDAAIEWRLHVRAVARLAANNGTGDRRPSTSPEQGGPQCPDEVAIDGFYVEAYNHGLEFGPAFRSIDRLWSGNHEAVGEICLLETLHDQSPMYGVHPALLDGALQLLVAAGTGGIAAG